jgi:hypothetical protein
LGQERKKQKQQQQQQQQTKKSGENYYFRGSGTHRNIERSAIKIAPLESATQI